MHPRANTKTIGQIASDGPERTFELGRRLGKLLGAGDVVGLDGELGAGKTCFAQGVAVGLEVDPRVRVVSPSFTLINEYPGRIPLVHIDLYRLDDSDEMVEIGVFDYFGGEGACIVEWFERCEEHPLVEQLRILLRVTGDNTRIFEVSASGVRHRQLASEWLAAAA